jgi:hypothetical protein
MKNWYFEVGMWMYPDFLVPLCALGVLLIVSVTAILARTISAYKLKAEQIRADAMVRAEEVRSRNQLELEKLMREDKEDSVSRSAFSDGDLQRIHKESGEDILTDYEEPRQRSRVRD